MGSERGAAVVVVLVLVGGFAYSQADAASSASGGCAVEAVAVDGVDKKQIRHAAAIAEVGVDMDMGRRGVVVALATAMQESGLRNLPHLGARNDHDSVGLFQQRASWGTEEERRTPKVAARKFFRALKRVKGWRKMRITEAAQAVQRSAYPEAYQRHTPQARRLAKALLRRCGR